MCGARYRSQGAQWLSYFRRRWEAVRENRLELKTADVQLLFARRMKLPEDQMKVIRAHWEAGWPICC